MDIINALLLTFFKYKKITLVSNIRGILRKKTIFLKEILISPFEFIIILYIIPIDENKEKKKKYYQKKNIKKHLLIKIRDIFFVKKLFLYIFIYYLLK